MDTDGDGLVAMLVLTQSLRQQQRGCIGTISRCEILCLGIASPTPEGLSLISRGCARHERTPGKGARDACHPGGVIPSPKLLDGLVPGEPLRGSRVLRRESGGVGRSSLHPRLFTVNPSGVRPCDARDKWVGLWLRRPRLAKVLLGRETTCTGQSARTYAKIATIRKSPAPTARSFRAAAVWSAVTCHRFCAGDLSPSDFGARPATRACRRWREP